jgi:methylated-DNA-[protein]-cysteine S-methyltransferase
MAGAWRGHKLSALTFHHSSPQTAVESVVSVLESRRSGILTSCVVEDEPTGIQSSLVVRLQAFASGDDIDFQDIELDIACLTEFQRKVTLSCRAIPPGQVLTYGQLATQAGSPGAARAVGQVMARNRWPLVVPCHRVIAAQGRLGGFSAPNGRDVKKKLLDREGVQLGKRLTPSQNG